MAACYAQGRRREIGCSRSAAVAYCVKTTPSPLAKTTRLISRVTSKPCEVSVPSRLRFACPARVGSERSADEIPSASSISRVTVMVGMRSVQSQLFMMTETTPSPSPARAMTAHNRSHVGIVTVTAFRWLGPWPFRVVWTVGAECSLRLTSAAARTRKRRTRHALELRLLGQGGPPGRGRPSRWRPWTY
jgi:hypothetical protein